MNYFIIACILGYFIWCIYRNYKKKKNLKSKCHDCPLSGNCH
ncbi:FeoB-associated Cys-rich membrane protein [Thomasclavelia sp.]